MNKIYAPTGLVTLRKFALPITLGIALLVLGTAVDFLFEYIEHFYRAAFKLAGIPTWYDRLSGQAFNMKVLTLIILNAGFCLWILLALFKNRTKRKIILWVYAGIFLLPLFFALVVKLTGDDPSLHQRSRALIDYTLLTPFPLVFLTPVLLLFKIPDPTQKGVILSNNVASSK